MAHLMYSSHVNSALHSPAYVCVCIGEYRILSQVQLQKKNLPLKLEIRKMGGSSCCVSTVRRRVHFSPLLQEASSACGSSACLYLSNPRLFTSVCEYFIFCLVTPNSSLPRFQNFFTFSSNFPPDCVFCSSLSMLRRNMRIFLKRIDQGFEVRAFLFRYNEYAVTLKKKKKKKKGREHFG